MPVLNIRSKSGHPDRDRSISRDGDSATENRQVSNPPNVSGHILPEPSVQWCILHRFFKLKQNSLVIARRMKLPFPEVERVLRLRTIPVDSDRRQTFAEKQGDAPRFPHERALAIKAAA